MKKHNDYNLYQNKCDNKNCSAILVSIDVINYFSITDLVNVYILNGLINFICTHFFINKVSQSFLCQEKKARHIIKKVLLLSPKLGYYIFILFSA